jgi:hypothetical protein
MKPQDELTLWHLSGKLAEFAGNNWMLNQTVEYHKSPITNGTGNFCNKPNAALRSSLLAGVSSLIVVGGPSFSRFVKPAGIGETCCFHLLAPVP